MSTTSNDTHDDGMNGYSSLTVREAGEVAANKGVSLAVLLGLKSLLCAVNNLNHRDA